MKQVVLSNESWISLTLPKRNGGHSSVYSQKKKKKKKNRGANPPQKGRGYCERVINDLLLITVFVNPKNITI